MKKGIGTLSTDGYVTEPKKIMSYLFAHIHEVRDDDTNIYFGHTTSIAKLIAVHGNVPEEFAVELRTSLNECFSRFFDEVEVTTKVKGDVKDDARYGVDIDLVVTKDGQSYSLGRELSVDPVTSAYRLIEELTR